MAFPQDPLDVDVELQIGGVWTDITTDAYTRSPIGTECGRSEESTRTDPSKASLELNNRLGKYSPRNPMSPYYGLIGRNTPVRIAVNDGDTYLRTTGQLNTGASTPDTAALDITGDIDVRFDATLDNWVPPVGAQHVDLAGKFSSVGNQRSWMLQSREGRIHLEWSPDGTTTIGAQSTVAPTLPPSRRMAWRAALDVNNGAGGWTVTFYTAETIAGPWVQLGDPVTGAGVTAIFNSTTVLKVGDATNLLYAESSGQVHAFELRNGIGGTVVANPYFAGQTPGAPSVTDSTGKVWMMAANGSISNRHLVFSGVISSWPTRWDLSGEDVWVSVEASGPLRRLGQGTKSLDSTLRRRLPSYSPLAYWPCEDSNGSTQAYSPLARGSALAVQGWDFAQDDSLGGSAALPTVTPGGTLRGRIPPPDPATNAWALCLLYRVDGAAPVAEQELMSWTTTGTIRRWRITMGTSGTHLFGYDASGALVLDSAIAPISVAFLGWTRLEFAAQQSGGNITYRIGWTPVGNGTTTNIPGSIAGTVGVLNQIDTVFGAGLPDIRVGHITAWATDVIAAAYDSADHGFTGETATSRMSRLATEESRTVALSVYTDPAKPSMALGSQRPEDLLTLLQDCADADGGILYESKTDASLTYRDRQTLYNQTPGLVLSYTAEGEIGPPLEPIDDDQKSRNDITVSRTAGSSARAVQETGPMSTAAPPNGIGVYDDSVTLNLADDNQPPQIAAWRLHLGTWDEARYPTVRLMLHAAPHLIPAALRLTVGDRIQITDLPPWLPPGPLDLIVQGWSQVIDQYTWDIVLNCTPAGPWTIGVLDDKLLGRLGTDGSTLGSGVSANATSMTFVSSPGPRWIDSAGFPTEFPFDVLIGGEQVRVTGITGTTLTQTATVVRSVNGITKSHSAGASIRLAQPLILAL
ncbi:hypothetical protein [Streptomyces sp. WAC01280]|uniref:hypothetical protein n=1 Tax=Streptomyces sp. WAC01280 TaxID=2487424 RepID=UPI000F772E3A|nr:hypothetical protein [Streptomyces sp. WAC01280]RSS51364.1 hypothetical protein EF909_34285 [Streptomyces sp. WAC01280]